MREVDGREIMIVEDDVGVRDGLAELLEGEGYLVLRAANGREAFDRLRGDDPVPALIIVDLLMPVMGGHEFCSVIKSDPDLAGIPLIVMSADGRLGERAGDVEADAYLKKPLDMRALLTAVGHHCVAR